MLAFAATAALQRPGRHAWTAGTVVIALVLLATAGSCGVGNDNLSDLMLFATGLAVLPARLIWTSRISGTGDDAPPTTTLTCVSALKENAMDSYLMFLNCPAYMDNNGAARCGLPAEVHYRYTMNSTDGPLEGAKISCPRGHHFNGPIDCLTVPEQPPATAAPASPPQSAGQSTRPQARWDGERP